MGRPSPIELTALVEELAAGRLAAGRWPNHGVRRLRAIACGEGLRYARRFGPELDDLVQEWFASGQAARFVASAAGVGPGGDEALKRLRRSLRLRACDLSRARMRRQRPLRAHLADQIRRCAMRPAGRLVLRRGWVVGRDADGDCDPGHCRSVAAVELPAIGRGTYRSRAAKSAYERWVQEELRHHGGRARLHDLAAALAAGRADEGKLTAGRAGGEQPLIEALDWWLGLRPLSPVQRTAVALREAAGADFRAIAAAVGLANAEQARTVYDAAVRRRRCESGPGAPPRHGATPIPPRARMPA